MEEQDEEGAPTPPLEQRIGGVERRGLVDIVRIDFSCFYYWKQ